MRLIPFFACLALCACQPTLVAEFQDKAVVESYLYANNSPTVKVSKLIALRSDVSYSSENVDALQMTVTDETAERTYTLQPQGDGLYANASLKVTEGHTYTLTLPYNGEQVTATTTIPPKPQGMTLSAAVMEIPQRPNMAMAANASRADSGWEPITVTWDNAAGDYYIIVAECIESSPTSIYTISDDDDIPRPMFRTEPTTAAESQLSMQSFSYYGRHNVILVRMQPEYLLLYKSTGNTIAEIHANIENGYGIFTGVNADTLQINVKAVSMGF